METQPKPSVRVRFAPSPTGTMHVGNARTAVLNYAFARQHGGTFVLRIEDTDPTRNYDPGAKNIIDTLGWLGLSYDEGPGLGGPYEPYFQSKRTGIYQKVLEQLQKLNRVYPCFCSEVELAKKRDYQIALKLPPRYDRTCLRLDLHKAKALMEAGNPFVWRFKIDATEQIEVQDLSRRTIKFDMRHFGDFPITRADGSFTFMFANFVDDWKMKISHVLRGCDHLSNTAGQAALFKAVGTNAPIFWHMPVICDEFGKKLSKRHACASVRELRASGFLPQAIVNYLAIMGGGKVSKEVLSLQELVEALDFQQVPKSAQARFDLKKLTWLNQQWIRRLPIPELHAYSKPFIEHIALQNQVKLENFSVEPILEAVKGEIDLLSDVYEKIKPYVEVPTYKPTEIAQLLSKYGPATVAELLKGIVTNLNADAKTDLPSDKVLAKLQNSERFKLIRFALTGKFRGPSLHDLLELLPTNEVENRLKGAVKFLETLSVN